MKVILDADSLIKLTKAKAKEIVLKNMEAYIPPKVFEETVEIPKEEGYPDAFLIADNLKKGLLAVEKIEENKEAEAMITKLGIRGGEADVFRLYKSGDFDVVSSDDGKFLEMLDALNVPYITPSALVVSDRGFIEGRVISGEDGRCR